MLAFYRQPRIYTLIQNINTTTKRSILKKINLKHYGDIDQHYNNDHNGIQVLYPKLQNRSDIFRSIGAWNWKLSRVMYYLKTDSDINRIEFILTGLSRLCKAAFWAGETDEHFAILICTDFGKGDYALFKSVWRSDSEH